MKSSAEAAFAILAAVIGAGFASGRETVVFFARFGDASWLGVLIAGLLMGTLSYMIMNLAAHNNAHSLSRLASAVLGRELGLIASGIYALTMLVTCGAMASGISEVASLTLTIYNAKFVGLLIGVIVCAYLASCGTQTLASLGSFLVPVCAILFIVIAVRKPLPSLIDLRGAPSTILQLPTALSYAFLNIALSCGIIGEVGRPLKRFRKFLVAIIFSILITMLMAVSNAVILPNIERLYMEPLPLLTLASGSTFASMLAAMTLIIAMASTLAALIRSTALMIPLPFTPSIVICAAISAMLGNIGFNVLIGDIYPIMGWICAIVLVVVIAVGIVRQRRQRQL